MRYHFITLWLIFVGQDGYKIIAFLDDFKKNAWIKRLSPNPTASQNIFYDGATDKQFWANVKDTGELLLGNDLPPGSDMISQILSQPKAADSMEFELFGRLSACI